jgi:ubiquinone/menaquinone biosynthesis C-methylase UbiE
VVDWTAWNNRYDDPDDWLVSRLRIVQQQLTDVLDRRPPGPLRLISVCAGQGRDVIEVLSGHPRCGEVSALLVELDRATVDTGRDLAAAAGLTGVRFVVGDAARTDLYQSTAPADIVLVCGVFGNITVEDIEATIGLLPQLCAPGAAVIWTRGRHDSTTDLVPAIREWFTRAGFTQRDLHSSPAGFTVGRHDYSGPAQPLTDGESMFTFHGYDQLSATTGGASVTVDTTPR